MSPMIFYFLFFSFFSELERSHTLPAINKSLLLLLLPTSSFSSQIRLTSLISSFFYLFLGGDFNLFYYVLSQFTARSCENKSYFTQILLYCTTLRCSEWKSWQSSRPNKPSSRVSYVPSRRRRVSYDRILSVE